MMKKEQIKQEHTRNAFYVFSMLVFLFCIQYAMHACFSFIGRGKEYPFLLQGIWLLSALVFCCAFLLCSALGAKKRDLTLHVSQSGLVEGILAAVILIAAFLVRLVYIEKMPVEPESDYRLYYELALYLCSGKPLASSNYYTNYISLFPHVYGYPKLLSLFYVLSGDTSVLTSLLFNLFAQIVSFIAVWRTARLLAGRLAGIAALLLVSFLPSTILYSNIVASEPVFTAILFCAIWMFFLSLSDTPRHRHHPSSPIIELCGAGFLAAFASFVRPAALIFLVAALLYLVLADVPALDARSAPLVRRTVDEGWKRGILLVLCYFLLSGLLKVGVSAAVERKLVSTSASYGYNLMVGLNVNSTGGWNQEDSQFLYDNLERTGSAEQTHLACRNVAVQRLHENWRKLLNLFVQKFERLWGNDEYGASWSSSFMSEQGTLNEGRRSFYEQMTAVSNFYYLFLLLGAFVFGCITIHSEPEPGWTLILLFCGTVVMHLLVESQNRYHYHALPLLCILSGAALGKVRNFVTNRQSQKL